MNEQSRVIPTNIITGFLGVGKTTSINSLLAHKPAGESWAVLVNEFGQVGIDQEMMPDQDGLHVKELTGGCICCAMGPSLNKTLQALIEQAQPDRLIIEPTGIGHPEGIIDTLMGPALRDKLDLRATVCLLDPRLLEQPDVIDNETFHDQLNLADVVLINKCDLADAAQLELAETSLGNMFPPKQYVGRTTRGVIDPALLDLVRDGQLQAQFPDAHKHQHHDHDHQHDHAHNHGHDHDHQHGHNHQHSHDHSQASPAEQIPEPGKPIRKTGNGSGLFSCGWIFHRDDCFDYWALEEVLNSLEGISRIKGVIHIDGAWVFYNRVQNEHDFDKVAYRRDSRIEIISSRELDWPQIEQDMIACMIEA
ncbi:CobW family GTP-binding protein [Oceanobacter mangrovi]|uniref:CobW family GTP-binding protein n=1 Tax=Oceanobacter mangrovi TaxID=2862510 RepID=UPI001C8DBDDF|nr:GTP-binding protein [Oceanobacter mangrovi]